MLIPKREERKLVPLNAYEEGAVIEGLNKIRTEQLEKDGASDFVSDLMLKIIQAPTKKARVNEAPGNYRSCIYDPTKKIRVNEAPENYRSLIPEKGGSAPSSGLLSINGEAARRSRRVRDEAR